MTDRAPHDRPTVAEIVEAVREWLDGEVAAATSGRLAFHARVAANMLAMVERELALGSAMGDAHARRLAALGCTDDRDLADKIRSGGLDDAWSEVVAAVTATVRDKLAVANPRYLDGD